MELVTAQQLRDIREQNPGMGLFEAKRIALKANALKALDTATTVEDLVKIIGMLVNRM